MAVRGFEKFEFLPTFLKHGYLASLSTEPLEILLMRTSLPYGGNHVSDFLFRS